jgi:endo-1,4-beta-xylanase
MGVVIQVNPGSIVRIDELTISQEPDGAWHEPGWVDEPLRELAAERGITIGAEFNSWGSIHDPRYLETLAREFNLLVPGGELAWNWVLKPSRDHFEFSLADQILHFAQDNDMRMRAYLLPTGNNLEDFPAWFLDSDFSSEELLSIVDEHIQTVMSHYQGQVDEWLITSETIWNGEFVGWNYWLNQYGVSFIEHVFRYAHDIDPDATLIYEFTENEGLNSQSNAVYNHLRSLIERGVPIDAVGMEAHLFHWSALEKEDILANMRRLADLGLEIYVMEMDVNMYNGEPGISNEELNNQARIYRDMLEICLAINDEFGRVVCKSFTLWGFTDAHSWIFYPAYPYGGGEAPLIFDDQYNPKPAYYAIQEALRSQ